MLTKSILAALAATAYASPSARNLLLPRTSCSTPDGDGSCESTSSCGGFSVPGYCAGASDIQCCVVESCSTGSGDGTCMSTSSSCSGSFVSGYCPGSSDVECCVGSSGGGGSGGPPTIPSAAITMIEQLEGFEANFYDAGDGDETIGYGHDCTQQGDCSSITAPITEAQGQTLLMTDLVQFETCVCDLSGSSGLNANQYGALVSFSYNAGCGSLDDYLASYVEDGDYSGACNALPTTVTDGGELDSRRQTEANFCNTASSTGSGC